MESNSPNQFTAPHHFREVWNSFWKKQTWDFDLHCKLCARPGLKYEVDEIVADGVCIGVQRDRCPNLHTPKDVFPAATVKVDMSNLQRTRFSHNKSTQQKMMSLLVTYFGYFKRDMKVAKLKSEESADVLNELKNNARYQHFYDFFLWADDKSHYPSNDSFVFCVYYLNYV